MRLPLPGTALLAVLVIASGLAVAAPSPFATAPTAAAVPVWTASLHGSAVSPRMGWGLNATAITTPGPTLFVTTGDALHLHLFSQDGATHTWFVDRNNDSAAQATEPQSDPFNATTGPVWYNFTVNLTAGTYMYRCAVHPSQMYGLLVVRAAPTFVLWGSYSPVNGWGLTNASITYPGPTLNVTENQTVTIDLFSADGVDHTFYVDFAKTGSGTGNAVSETFNGTHPVRFTFVATPSGNFTYACSLHGQTSMKGTLHIAATSTPPPPPPPPPDYTLYAVAVVVIAVIAIAAAVVIRRRPRTPPARPPETPPPPPQG